jgi:hypothetical protein
MGKVITFILCAIINNPPILNIKFWGRAASLQNNAAPAPQHCVQIMQSKSAKKGKGRNFLLMNGKSVNPDEEGVHKKRNNDSRLLL